MTDADVRALLVCASRSLGEAEFWLRHLWWEEENLNFLADAQHYCDEAARKSLPDDAETAATIAVLRSTTAAFALWHCVKSEVNCDFDYDDGTLLDGMGEDDTEGLSRPFTEQAIRTARAALNADPEDALVPLHLGHALTWSGDRHGAVAAYEEALRRDPGETCARRCLEYFDALPANLPSSDATSWDEAIAWGKQPHISRTSHGRYGFSLLRVAFMVDNNTSDHRFLLFDSVDSACVYADKNLSAHAEDSADEDIENDEEAGQEVILHVHRPDHPIDEYDLSSRVQGASDAGPSRVDWANVSVHEPLEPPLPPGRPLRINTRTCFWSA